MWIVRALSEGGDLTDCGSSGSARGIAPLEPTPFIRGLPREQSEERRLQRFRDRATTAASDRDAIDRTHGCDFGRRAGQEDFVREIEQLARQRLLADFETVLAREGNDRVTRDALQDRTCERRRIDDAVADQEQVLARAFADVAVDAKADSLGEAEPLRLHADELAGQIIAGRFAHRRNRIRRKALPR